jgi:hypothetical protein
MKHHSLDELKTIAGVEGEPNLPMSRHERLCRWADILERNPHWHLRTLHQTERQPASVRARMRNDNSPLTIAFQDPVLRVAGLADDTYGEAKRFFELTDGQMHAVICHCHYGDTVSAAAAASSLRAMLAPPQPGLLASLRRWFVAQ